MTGPERGSLPLRDYDHLPLSSLAQRIRSLTAEELGVLLDYETAHANRLPVVQAIRARLAELERGAVPTGGREQAGPDWPRPASPHGSPVRPETTAPPASPPPHGNPAQPARPKANRQVP